MKTMRYTMFFGIILLLGIFMSACVDELDKESREGDGKSIRLTLRVPDDAIINPMTKALQTMSQKVENITVLVYDKEHDLITSKLYNIGADDALNTGGTYTTEAIPVGEGASGYVLAVANAGDLSGISYDDLKKKSFGLNETSPLPIMCASGGVFPDDPKTSDPSYSFKGIEFDATSNSNISIELVRIYARITVVVKRGDDLNQELTITPQTLKIYNVPQTGTLVGPNLIESSEGSLRDGEILKSIHKDDDKGNWDYTGNAEKTTDVLYLYENMQPDGYCGKDQTSKTPKSFGEAITNTTQLMTDTKSSFIEVYAKYERKNNPTTGWIKYRFFLGKDATTNFSVQRNVNYKVTLTLHKNGGVDEATWRVETEKIPGKINVSDVYISYLGGSSAEMVVTGDVEGISNYSKGDITDPGNTGKPINMEQVSRSDTEMRLKFTSDGTNIHDYKEKVMPVTFTMSDGKVYTVNVYQVPRLVDPIAIYKRADNDRATEIVVKAFSIDSLSSKGLGLYQVLKSRGKWTAEIDAACTEWVLISKTNDNYKTNSIEGEGEVRFWYKPKNKLLNNEEGDNGKVNSGRYGKITVKYHGASCVHEIFLRQGYQPMMLGDQKYAWSAFNCLGKESNDPAVTGKTADYPTQTGWLFNGGTDIAMHPFRPGYQVGMGEPKSRTIRYSDKEDRAYGSGNPVFDHWQKEWYTSSGRTESKQGPCPKNYMVADARSYSDMAKSTLLYTGYVHDDDEVKGWKYSNLSEGLDIDADADVEDNNHCNPAKGSLYVEKGGGNRNLFFNYGKGVLTGVRALNNGKGGDQYVLDEIGVGRRHTYDADKFGSLVYSSSSTDKQAYGAIYWNASPYVNNRLGKVDFGYNIYTPTPTVIDVPYENNSQGMEITHNAQFVRCVRSLVDKIDLQILATVKSGMFGGPKLEAIYIRVAGTTDIWPASVDENGKCGIVRGIPKADNYEIGWNMYNSPPSKYVLCSYSTLMDSSATIKVSLY